METTTTKRQASLLTACPWLKRRVPVSVKQGFNQQDVYAHGGRLFWRGADIGARHEARE